MHHNYTWVNCPFYIFVMHLQAARRGKPTHNRRTTSPLGHINLEQFKAALRDFKFTEHFRNSVLQVSYLGPILKVHHESQSISKRTPLGTMFTLNTQNNLVNWKIVVPIILREIITEHLVSQIFVWWLTHLPQSSSSSSSNIRTYGS